MSRWRQWLWLVIWGGISWPAAAALGVSLSQGFPAATQIASGMLVSIDEDALAVPATIATANELIGVAVEAESSPVSVERGDSAEVQVASAGIAEVLVSDIAGPIRRGDQITASPLAGVGMKVAPDQSAKVVGTAQSAFAGSDDIRRLSDQDGNTVEVSLGRIPVLVSPGTYVASTGPLAFLQQAGTTLAGRPVSAPKALLATLTMLVAIISVSILLYSSVRSGLISIGRNPLAEAAVKSQLFKVIMLTPLILGAAIGLVYVILVG